jgi:hypothetical protein
MDRRNKVVLALISASALVLGASGCEKKTASTDGNGTPRAGTTAATIPASYFVETAPAEAKGIVEVKKAAKAGDEVVMQGRIAGREDPFTAGRASFLMTDMSLAVCEDGCKTPWDHCCDSAKDIAANAATVQLVDDKGEVIKAPANGVHGLAPNAELVVIGTVKSLDEAGNMVVDVKKG